MEALTIQTFVSKMVFAFNTQSGFVIAFLPRSNCLLISWLRSPSAVILEPKERKCVTASTFSPSIRHEVMGPDAKNPSFLILNIKSAFFHSPPSFSSRESSSTSLSSIRVVSSVSLRLLMFLVAILSPACSSSSIWS